MKKIRYYLRVEGQPKTAVTVFQNELGQSARGVAICSNLDQFVKAEGRSLSNDRCAKSYKREQSFGPIRRQGLLVDESFKYKCEWMPELTKFEKELLKDPESV
jgi:hypothetical protein